MRPNIHIEDMADLYVKLLECPDGLIAGKIYNAGYENSTVAQLAEKVRTVVEQEMPGQKRIEVVTTPSHDQRSYHISSEKIRRELGFVPRRTIEDAVRDLVAAFRSGRIPNPLTEMRYYNIKTMQAVSLPERELCESR